MFLQSEGVLLNRASVSKWGFDIGTVTLAFRRDERTAFASVFWLVSQRIIADETLTWLSISIAILALLIAAGGSLFDYREELRVLRLIAELNASRDSPAQLK